MMALAPVHAQPSNGLTQAQFVFGGKLVKETPLLSLMSGCIHILTHPSAPKHLYQVILLVLSDGVASLFATSEIAQPCMRLFNVAVSRPCPLLPIKGNTDVY